MAVEFKIQNFFYPVDILRLKLSLDRSQWFSKEQLKIYQLQRLSLILDHSYKNVPYYRNLFNDLKLKPRDIKTTEDLTKIPLLSKNTLKRSFRSLIADNAQQFSPHLCRTSGTTGEPKEFYQDGPSNILEFCYYWRYWSWAGYKLGDRFAEFTLNHFLNKNIDATSDYSLLTNRLMLNPAQLSYEKTNNFISILKKYKPQFLKGSPSSIYIFAKLLGVKDISPVKLKAIFTTGELLLNSQKELIENTFHCKIFDSYGHMERTVAICQCPLGQYHINSDYGFLEMEDVEKNPSSDLIRGRIIGTSLYNFAMPLIRYELNDALEISKNAKECECGRGLPLCKTIVGRMQDVITTTDGRFLTNVFILFDILEGVLWCQIVQEKVNKIRVRLAKDTNFSIKSLEEFMRQLRWLLTNETIIEVEYLSEQIIPSLLSQKYKPIVSTIITDK